MIKSTMNEVREIGEREERLERKGQIVKSGVWEFACGTRREGGEREREREREVENLKC
jgi:hypothetical protein